MTGFFSRALRRLGALCVVGLALVPSGAAAGPLWSLGLADARLIDAGWRFDSKAGDWVPEVELRLVNRDLHKAFHRSVRVEFIGVSGKVWVWKTFVALAPGTAQHRRISAPGLPGCVGPLSNCPLLGLRVDLKPHDPAAGVQPIPGVALDDPDAPPAGQPLYVAAVEDGDVLRLLDGRRIKPLGLRFTSSVQEAEASRWVRTQVMDAPIEVGYDAVPPDKSGRWQAYVRLPDGRDLGSELLRRSLALPDTRTRFSREADYRSINTGAAARGSKAS